MRSLDVEGAVLGRVHGALKDAVADAAVHLAGRLVPHHPVVVGVVQVGEGQASWALGMIVLKQWELSLSLKNRSKIIPSHYF